MTDIPSLVRAMRSASNDCPTERLQSVRDIRADCAQVVELMEPPLDGYWDRAMLLACCTSEDPRVRCAAWSLLLQHWSTNPVAKSTQRQAALLRWIAVLDLAKLMTIVAWRTKRLGVHISPQETADIVGDFVLRPGKENKSRGEHSLDTYRPKRGRLDSWVIAAVVQFGRDQRKTERSRARRLSELSRADPASVWEDGPMHLEEARQILCDGLTERQRQMLDLKLGGHLSVEIARILGVTANAVDAAIGRIRTRVARTISEESEYAENPFIRRFLAATRMDQAGSVSDTLGNAKGSESHDLR